MLNLEMMPEKTKKTFSMLAACAELKDFILIGGTALSIQLHHRLSEDLDFCLFSENFKSNQLDYMLQGLSANHQIKLMTSPSKITQARINGWNLLDKSRDYTIDGVKVTFFARLDAAYEHFSQLKTFSAPDTAFKIASEESIFTMKSWLLQKRVKSRDLFDVMQMIIKGDRSIADVINEAKSADIANHSEEMIKSALTGVTPLDVDDEGFDPIGLDCEMDDIYSFFKEHVDEYEVAMATALHRKKNSRS